MEIRVVASNDSFAGATDIYVNYPMLEEIANSLQGFPVNIDHTASFVGGKQGSGAFVSMDFYCFSAVGHSAVTINLETDVSLGNKIEKKHVVSLTMQIESNAVTSFAKGLRNMVSHQTGRTGLQGIARCAQNIQ